MSFPVVFLVLIFAVPTFATRPSQAGNLLITACDQTQYKDYCKTELKDAPTTDLPSLAGYTLVRVKTIAQQCADKANVQQTPSPTTGPQLAAKHCFEMYNDAVKFLDQATTQLAAKNYQTFDRSVGHALLSQASCTNGYVLGGVRSLFNDDLNTQFKQVGEILSTMSSILAKN